VVSCQAVVRADTSGSPRSVSSSHSDLVDFRARLATTQSPLKLASLPAFELAGTSSGPNTCGSSDSPVIPS
jgi:hypothetical protein